MVKLIQSATEFELSPTLATSELVAQKRAKGEQVLQMGFGESPFPVPTRLKQALQDSSGRKEYAPVAGLPELREAVKALYAEKYGMDTDRYTVLIGPGSKLIIYALQMAVEGDLLMPVPSWVSYGPQARLLRTQIIKVPAALGDDGYRLDAGQLDKAVKQARADGLNPSKLILNYPNNPTGLTMDEKNLEEIAAFCRQEDIFIISDEIYSHVAFDGRYRTISRYAPERTAISSALSKHLSLGGWRLGFCFIPKEVEGLSALMSSIASETWSCVPSPIQQAAIEAYKGHSDVETHTQDCTSIHAYVNGYIARALRAAGIECALPQGAFYTYPNLERFRGALAERGVRTGRDLVAFLMEQYSLAALPGIAFGEAPEVLTLRLSGCDYDGQAVLNAYRAGEVLDEAFIAKYAPRVKAAVEAFARLVEDLK